MAHDLLIRNALVLDGSGRKSLHCVRLNAATRRDGRCPVERARGPGRVPDCFDA